MSKKSKQQGGVRIPRFIINTGKFIQFFSADWAVKYVSYLFRKPFNHKMPEAEKPLLEEAKISFIDIPEIKKRIAVYQWAGEGNKKALVVR